MKLLINLCAHDGIISHFAGVGTIVKRYIEAIELILNEKNIKYDLNLITPLYNTDSFGYSEATKICNSKNKKNKIIIIDNGSNGKTAYGTPENWYKLCCNTANYINKACIEEYDIIITIANDTPFACLLEMLKKNSMHKKIWIPHSTVKIHEVDSALKNSTEIYDERLTWENKAVSFINNDQYSFLGATGNYILNHLITEYGLKKNKQIYIPNGEILSKETTYESNHICEKMFEKIKNEKALIMAFGRAEKYKNLEATILLGELLKIKSILITKAYFKGQPIIRKYKKMGKSSNSEIFVDVPFHFPHYIINNFKGPIILLIPSKKEIVGLIINEIRKMNKNNVLIVANNIGGLAEQIDDGKDGVLVELDNLKNSSNKITKYFTNKKIELLNKNAQNRLFNDYNFEFIFDNFLRELIGEEYE